MTIPHIASIVPEELTAWLEANGHSSYRAGQILDWVFKRYAASFDAMTNLPREMRSNMAQSLDIAPLKEVKRLESADGLTGKVLLEMADGEQVESVWMNDRGRFTFCISSQVGCPLGCKFCATGGAGFTRNLELHEILGQVLALARITGAVRNIVFMGMGEPLLNLGSVLPALDALVDKRRFGLNPRHITISTAGITSGVFDLAEHRVHPNLALSLNSPFDDKRVELMPVTRKYPLGEVIDACVFYAAKTKMPVLLEYVLLGGVNTDPSAARATADVAKRLKAVVNVIEYNPVSGAGILPPNREEIVAFRRILEAEGVETVQRFRRGCDIEAACGQLRGRQAGK